MTNTAVSQLLKRAANNEEMEHTLDFTKAVIGYRRDGNDVEAFTDIPYLPIINKNIVTQKKQKQTCKLG
jgi:hypothetical protein